jgi:hypothetical protein
MSEEQRKDETEVEGHAQRVGATDVPAEEDEDENDFEAHRILYPNVRMD